MDKNKIYFIGLIVIFALMLVGLPLLLTYLDHQDSAKYNSILKGRSELDLNCTELNELYNMNLYHDIDAQRILIIMSGKGCLK